MCWDVPLFHNVCKSRTKAEQKQEQKHYCAVLHSKNFRVIKVKVVGEFVCKL